MSYQVLARKYRPKNFDTLVGQEHVVRALTHALQTGRLHHAYLFTGTRGVGKTTLSRILAKSFNCVGADGQGGITASPCGVCEVCLAIDAGRFVDYIEMDAASNRGVDEMAQLLEQAVYAPSNARFKVYMIDEVHMLTNTAFNAMLKTLEEPPPHIKFILATTDPQKIPVTVLSRCLQFNLKQMPPGHIIGHLEHILGLEQIEFETAALRLLAQGAHGSMRDALSLTDQAIAYAAGKVTLDAVQGMLGALDQSFLLRLIDALVREDGATLLAVADEMASRSLSYNAALQDLATLLHQMALAQTVPQALPLDLPEREEVLRLAGLLDAEEVQLFYQIAVHGRNELGLAPDEYAGFTMSLLRMLAFRPSSLGASPPPPSGGQRPASAVPDARSQALAASRAASVSSNTNSATVTASAQANPVAVPTPGLDARAQAMAALRGSGSNVKAASSPAAASPVSPAAPVMAEVPVVKPATTLAPATVAPAPPASNASLERQAATAQLVEANPAESSVNKLTTDNRPIPVKNSSPASSAPPDDLPPWDMDDGAWSSDAAAAFFGGQSDDAPPARRAAPRENMRSAPAANQRPAAFSYDNIPANFADPAPVDEPAAGTATARQNSGGNNAHSQAIARALQIANRAGTKTTAPKTNSGNTSNASNASNDDAMTDGGAPVQEAVPAKFAPIGEPPPFLKIPVAQLQWDGDWPVLAASANVRGIVKQLAFESELFACVENGNNVELHIKTPLQTLATDTNIEKLAQALSEQFGQTIKVLVKVEGPVWHTANARAEAARALRQLAAERSVQEDEFVQSLVREFDGFVVMETIRPIDLAA